MILSWHSILIKVEDLHGNLFHRADNDSVSRVQTDYLITASVCKSSHPSSILILDNRSIRNFHFLRLPSYENSNRSPYNNNNNNSSSITHETRNDKRRMTNPFATTIQLTIWIPFQQTPSNRTPSFTRFNHLHIFGLRQDRNDSWPPIINTWIFTRKKMERRGYDGKG